MAKHLKSNAINKCIGCFSCQRVCATVNHQSFSDNMSGIRIRTLGGMSSSYFANHCLGCNTDTPACVEVCPTEALTKRKGGGVRLDESHCIGCKKCEAACFAKAIHFVKDYKYPIVCKQCGICVKYCPHNCLSMEETEDAE